jgi:hypothetical protein
LDATGIVTKIRKISRHARDMILAVSISHLVVMDIVRAILPTIDAIPPRALPIPHLAARDTVIPIGTTRNARMTRALKITTRLVRDIVKNSRMHKDVPGIVTPVRKLSRNVRGITRV